jgi:nitric oxide reductase subunit B
LSIPLFYAAGLAFGSRPNFTVMDFWRFWVVHLWVEDFLEPSFRKFGFGFL